MMKRPAFLSALVLMTAVVAAGCGSAGPPSETRAAPAPIPKRFAAHVRTKDGMDVRMSTIRRGSHICQSLKVVVSRSGHEEGQTTETCEPAVDGALLLRRADARYAVLAIGRPGRSPLLHVLRERKVTRVRGPSGPLVVDLTRSNCAPGPLFCQALLK